MVMVPCSNVSSRLMVRQSVDFPDPEIPFTNTNPFRGKVTFISCSTFTGELG